MSFIKLVLLLAIGTGAYKYWQEHKQQGSGQDAAQAAGSPGRFVSLPGVEGHSRSTIVVVAAQDCPKEDAKRADQLAEALSRSGLPVVRTHSVSFDLPGGDQADVGKINQVMNGKLPIVFVNGLAKANPSLDEVVAQYQASR